MDDSIILQAQNKNEQAIEQVCTKYKPVVRRIARKYFLINGEIEDIIQEGMIGLHKAIVNYSPQKGKFEPFAIMIIKQQIIDAVKKSTTKKSGNLLNKLSIERDYFSEIENNSNLLENIEMKEEISERFRNVKKMLSNKEFKIFIYYLKGLSIGEIATKENINEKSVNNALYRIKSKIKEGTK